ncbi:hypothetical protein HN748_00845 [Candidatus Peregrinibacteria bacterium]|nr:hypothetical protein [Candidatus Peregrinibacteria bacterium]MBT7483408.1 hypothetical protein [Candidatus Peregrinibacteria bacterium]MBT7702758.1 hypothetical protein [Candidatus Peregrinibacteria bacterium]
MNAKPVLDQPYIKQIPKFATDISYLKKEGKDLDDAQVATWVRELSEKSVMLNVSNASPEEKERLQRVKDTHFADDDFLNLYDNPDEIATITKEISQNIVQNARDTFKQLVRHILENYVEDLVEEFNEFVVRHQTSAVAPYEGLHYKENALGPNAAEDPLWQEMDELFDEIADEFVGDFRRLVLDKLDPHSRITDELEIIKTLIFGVFDNTNRGIFYHYALAEKVTGAREKTVRFFKDAGVLLDR